jgi:antitoxin CptB
MPPPGTGEPGVDAARLRWRCRRGLLELDLIFTSALERHYPSMSPTEQQAFRSLLELGDNQLLEYFQGRAEPVEPELKKIIKKIL